MNPDKKVIILFNGPPDSGKDTSARLLAELFDEFNYEFETEEVMKIATENEPIDYVFLKFADNIRKVVCETFNISNDLLDKVKDIVNPVVPESGITIRQYMIKYAQEFMKPMLGKDIFGRLVAKDIKLMLYDIEPANCALITDLGFKEDDLFTLLKELREVRPLPKFIVCQLSRDGDFDDSAFRVKKDSRSYVNLIPEDISRYGTCAGFDITTVRIVNDGNNDNGATFTEDLKNKLREQILPLVVGEE